jgi:biotin carboxyl carrier protein
MEREFIYRGEKCRVAINPNGQAASDDSMFTAGVGEQKLDFSLCRISDNCFSLIINGKSRTVYAAENDDNIYVHIKGRVFRFDKIRQDSNKFAGGDFEYGSRDQVTTPMPGKVVKLLVGKGDTIELGQPLVIVESMKMENEIKSPTNGTVKSVHFQAGDLVKPDQPILRLIPAAD